MIRLIAWTLGILLAAQPIAQASDLEFLKDIKTIADSKTKDTNVKTFGDLLKAIHGKDVNHFVNQLPENVRDSKIALFEVKNNTLVFKQDKNATTLKFSNDGRSFALNGLLVTQEVLDHSIVNRDPSLILKHLEKIGAGKPSLLSLINYGLDALSNEAHALSMPALNFNSGGFPISQYFQSPWACIQCQYYGTWAGSNWIYPWHWQQVYWGTMVGQMAQGRYTNLMKATTASPYSTAAPVVQ